MPGQLVRPSEPPATVLPLADVGLLPCVSPQVGLQVAGLGVGLPAVVEGAGVDDDLPPAKPSPASFFLEGRGLEAALSESRGWRGWLGGPVIHWD